MFSRRTVYQSQFTFFILFMTESQILDLLAFLFHYRYLQQGNYMKVNCVVLNIPNTTERNVHAVIRMYF